MTSDGGQGGGTKRRQPAYSLGGTSSRYLSDNDDDGWGRPRQSTHFKPASLPKSLTFDGKSNWLAFKRKFIRMLPHPSGQRKNLWMPCAGVSLAKHQVFMH